LRELITRRSITKAIPMKDPVSGEIKTVTIKVNGPISLAETTTSTNVNPENLNRCFVLSIDESEEQTRLIHQLQRKNYTLPGFLQRREEAKMHVFAQRMLKPVLVLNPYAEALTFPSSSLKTRRDNEKFLRLIQAICFLHQYQRKLKRTKVSDHEVIEFIECSPQDYRIAYELLSDGVLDNTLDDLPASARKLLELIQKYLQERAERDSIPAEKVIFERKEIREYTSWSFAQVRNNFRILRDYECLQLIKTKNGLANQYRLTGNYSDVDFLTTILRPEELEKRLASGQ
jgi:DNA primase